MRDHSHHIELSRSEAVDSVLAALPEDFGCRRIEQVAITEAYGRVLAAPVCAKTNVPNVLTCCMDSIAVHWADFEGLPAGMLPDTSGWVRGTDWEFANTGVAMPEGFDTAIVIEHVTVAPDEQSVTIHAAPSERFAGTRAPGVQMQRGSVVVPEGTLVTADVAARIAAAGHATATVRPQPKVAFIPTGNELVPADVPFAVDAAETFAARGKVFESNGAVVRGKVEAWGGTLVPFDIVPDSREAIRNAIKQACRVADIVVLNAGSSKGSDDWSVEVLEDMGRIICHQTNHGPGHHSSYALVDGTPIVGISGPSGGASFTLNFYLLPVMKRFLGLDPAPVRIPARLAEPFAANRQMEKLMAADPAKLPGEQRPAEATEPGSRFYSIRFITLAAEADGTLSATPVPGRPGTPATEHANAYYMMAAGPDDVPPAVGDIIAVELRSPSL